MEFTILNARMTMEYRTQLLSERRAVDVVAIERELTKLWKEASEGIADPTSAPVVRACALNLIVVTGNEQDRQHVEEMVGDVTIEHPARIFLVVLNRHATDSNLDAWVSARCSLPVPGGKQVCCEQITLTAGGEETEKIPSIVTSLLVPDVPSIVLWKSVHEHDHLLHLLADVVNRMVIDSSEEHDPQPSLRSWGRLLHKVGRHVMLGDLAWTHLTAWRSVIAHTFNPEAMRPLLGQITNVKLGYSSTTQPRHSGLSQAFLLIGWLAERLHWRPLEQLHKDAQGNFTASFQFNDSAINVTIQLVPSRPGLPGGLESVALGAGDALSVTILATPHPNCVELTRQMPDGLTRETLHVLCDRSEATLVAQELEVMTRDAGYEAVLRTLMEVLKA